MREGRGRDRGRTPKVLVVATALTLVASSGVAAPSEYEPPPARCTSLGEGDHPAHVSWGRPIASGGCFFFSGPFELGRDDQLGSHARLTRRGDRVTLRFGAAVFEGRLRGDRISLHRRSRHDFGGAWVVDEYIEGELTTLRRGGESCVGLRARYRYEECRDGAVCEAGCTISAGLEVVGR